MDIYIYMPPLHECKYTGSCIFLMIVYSRYLMLETVGSNFISSGYIKYITISAKDLRPYLIMV